METERVKKLLKEALEENNSLFLTDFKVDSEGKVFIEIDGDQGVPLKECIRVSRHIEADYDKDVEDFALEVTTPNIALPLKVKRQYVKNLNRILTVKIKNNETFEGTLVNVTEKEITLRWKTREPKPIGKGKVTVEKTEQIDYNNIIEAIVKIVFN